MNLTIDTPIEFKACSNFKGKQAIIGKIDKELCVVFTEADELILYKRDTTCGMNGYKRVHSCEALVNFADANCPQAYHHWAILTRYAGRLWEEWIEMYKRHSTAIDAEGGIPLWVFGDRHCSGCKKLILAEQESQGDYCMACAEEPQEAVEWRVPKNSSLPTLPTTG